MAAAPAGSAEAEGRATTGAAQGATGVADTTASRTAAVRREVVRVGGRRAVAWAAPAEKEGRRAVVGGTAVDSARVVAREEALRPRQWCSYHSKRRNIRMGRNPPLWGV